MEKRRIGLIDFDTLHPGSRLWDISYALYRWVPLMSERNSENYGRHVDKSRRVEKFLSAYGKDVIDEEKIFAWIIKRLQYLVEFMKQEALNGDETFKQHIEEGHLQIYIDDIEYIKKNWLNP
jgi:thiamine kinase-like enzyme